MVGIVALGTFLFRKAPWPTLHNPNTLSYCAYLSPSLQPHLPTGVSSSPTSMPFLTILCSFMVKSNLKSRYATGIICYTVYTCKLAEKPDHSPTPSNSTCMPEEVPSAKTAYLLIHSMCYVWWMEL